MSSVEKDIIKSSTKLVKYEHDPIREFIINNQEYIVYGAILVILIVGIILLYHKEGFTNIFYKDIIDFDNIDGDTFQNENEISQITEFSFTGTEANPDDADSYRITINGTPVRAKQNYCLKYFLVKLQVHDTCYNIKQSKFLREYF